MIKVKFTLPRTIRVKLNSACQYKCSFCHQEGDAKAKDIDGGQLVRAMQIFSKDIGVDRIHFTGGEPTLYREFSNILQLCRRKGYDCALTTNGQFDAMKLPLLIESGLNSINFSLHTLDTYAFLRMQSLDTKISNSYKWANNCIEKTLKNITFASSILQTKVNCVVGNDFVSPQEVLNFCVKNRIKLRMLNNLGLGQVALSNINRIIGTNQAELIGHEITFLSSSHRLDYRIEDYEFGVKCIRNFYLKSMCENCKIRQNNKCLEGFYGIRLENNPLQVRLCLQQNKPPFIQDFDNFIVSEQYEEIKSIYSTIKNYLLHDLC